jgi:hypothetical protein
MLYAFTDKNKADKFSSSFDFRKFIYFCGHGEMAEWSKAHAWKVCNRQKRFMGSNPILSAFFLFFKRLSLKISTYLMAGKIKFDFMLIFSLIMVLLYIGMGIFIWVSKSVSYMPVEFRTIFAIFFVLYGIFRFVRIYPKLTNKNKDYED